jgi:hypothetical protein
VAKRAALLAILRKTMTRDQGNELANHVAIEPRSTSSSAPPTHPGSAGPTKDTNGLRAEFSAAHVIRVGDRVLAMASWDCDDGLVDNLLAAFAVAPLVEIANPDPSVLQRHRTIEKIARLLDDHSAVAVSAGILTKFRTEGRYHR